MQRLPPSIDVVYLTPRGKRCVLVPHGKAMGWLEFRYLDQATLAGNGFCLSRTNFFKVMREEPARPAFQQSGKRVAADA